MFLVSCNGTHVGFTGRFHSVRGYIRVLHTGIPVGGSTLVVYMVSYVQEGFGRFYRIHPGIYVKPCADSALQLVVCCKV